MLAAVLHWVHCGWGGGRGRQQLQGHHASLNRRQPDSQLLEDEMHLCQLRAWPSLILTPPPLAGAFHALLHPLSHVQGPMDTLDAVNEFDDDRGFIPQDFAIVKLLGKLGVQVRKAWLSGLLALYGQGETATSAFSIAWLPQFQRHGVEAHVGCQVVSFWL